MRGGCVHVHSCTNPPAFWSDSGNRPSCMVVHDPCVVEVQYSRFIERPVFKEGPLCRSLIPSVVDTELYTSHSHNRCWSVSWVDGNSSALPVALPPAPWFQPPFKHDWVIYSDEYEISLSNIWTKVENRCHVGLLGDSSLPSRQTQIYEMPSLYATYIHT